ncbi:MAG: DUF721 domain-containing protein [Proteobacteria bacterium]|nr:DUF721 domain-containing protein [Pseudomonadota bacterium]
MTIKRLGNLLNPNDDGGLGDIIRHARDMGKLVQILQNSLPAEEAGSIVAANIRGAGELIVLASSSAWASRLRFETDTLMAAARASGVEANTCTVRVARV